MKKSKRILTVLFRAVLVISVLCVPAFALTGTSRFQTGAGVHPSLGGMVFSHSLAAGGSFANDVIGTVARGEVAGSITGDMAAQSLSSYMGYASPGIGSRDAPIYSDVEIGRSRITGW